MLKTVYLTYDVKLKTYLKEKGFKYIICGLAPNERLYTINDIAIQMKMTQNSIRNYLRRGFEPGILQASPKYLLKS